MNLRIKLEQAEDCPLLKLRLNSEARLLGKISLLSTTSSFLRSEL